MPATSYAFKVQDSLDHQFKRNMLVLFSTYYIIQKFSSYQSLLPQRVINLPIPPLKGAPRLRAHCAFIRDHAHAPLTPAKENKQSENDRINKSLFLLCSF